MTIHLLHTDKLHIHVSILTGHDQAMHKNLRKKVRI
jgi:hypothetical protein